MRNLKIILSALLVLNFVFASAQKNSTKELPTKLTFSLFQPEDSLGRIVFAALDNFEKYGHFGAMENRIKNGKYILEFDSLFLRTASLPNDLADTNKVNPPVSIKEYSNLARKHGYFEYILFIEKKDTTTAVRKDETPYYYTTVRIFKLFRNKALIGDTTQHGAIYEVDLRIKAGQSEVKFVNIRLAENGDKNFFYLGPYGRHIYSTILVSNKLENLAVPIPPPYKPTMQPSKSNIFVHAGLQFTSFLQPEAMRNNVNPNYSFSGEESGQSLGVKYQKAFGKKGRFGILIGLEYEENKYNFQHENASFIYTSDDDYNALEDKEGTPYDKKYVAVKSYQEDGSFTYFKPEVGMFLNFGGKVLNFQVLGSIGNAFLSSNNYNANAIVSYQGEIDAIGIPISNDALGFYTDLNKEFSDEFNQIQNFMFYKAGFGMDICLGKRFSISFLGEYKGAFTYVFRKNSANQMFLDPENPGFYSQLNALSESRLYTGFAIQAGIKIYLNELR